MQFSMHGKVRNLGMTFGYEEQFDPNKSRGLTTASKNKKKQGSFGHGGLTNYLDNYKLKALRNWPLISLMFPGIYISAYGKKKEPHQKHLNSLRIHY